MISSCIVTYNSSDKVGFALDSLISSKEKCDVYVVDNLSEDSTAALIKKNYPNVHLIENNENMGFGRANNLVLPLINSTYHIMVNPDITFNADVIGRMKAYMDAHPQVAILTPRVLNEDGTEQFLPKRQPTLHYLLAGSFERFGWPFTAWRKKYTMQDKDYTKPFEIEFATGCFMFIRTDILKQLNGFDEQFFLYLEDTDLSRRAMKLGKLLYHPDFEVTHTWERDSLHSGDARKRHLASMRLFMRKWGWRL